MNRLLLIAAASREGSLNAARQGIAFAAKLGVPVCLAHVFHPEADAWPDAEENLDRLVGEARASGVAATARLLEVPEDLPNREDETRDALVKLVGELDAGCLVLATHSRPEADRVLLGGTAVRLLHAAPCPCLFVPPSSAVGTKVLAPVDSSPTSHRAAQVALDCVGHLASHVDWVSVAGSRERAAAHLEEDEAGRILQTFAALAAERQLPSATHLRHGPAAKEIVAAAAELGSGLVIIGTHGRSGLGGWLIGSVAEAVVRTSPCPVLLVPPEKH